MVYSRWFFLCTGEVVSEEQVWKFPKSHILGDLRDMTREQGRVTSLALWLTPADCLHVPPLHPDVTAYLPGEALLIQCRFEGCRNSQSWDSRHRLTLALVRGQELREDI